MKKVFAGSAGSVIEEIKNFLKDETDEFGYIELILEIVKDGKPNYR
jgi:hypothetical protein